jgi:pimeloyl-ACP methyl ester carboxylesterase
VSAVREDVFVGDEAELRYAMSGDARLAFRVRGHGPHEIVVVPSWLSNQDAEPPPGVVSFYDRLSSFATVVSYDQRGTGISDPVSLTELPTLEGRADDLHAVVTAAGVGPAVLVASNVAGPIAALYAASRPERTRGLVLINTFAAIARSDDYDAGRRPETLERLVDEVERRWGTGWFLQALNPDAGVPIDGQQADLARLERQYMPPATVGALMRQMNATDIRAVLPVISAPTLVVHTVENRMIPVATGRYLATHIPKARLVELPGGSNLFEDAILDEVEEFVTGARGATEPSRMLATLLFSDVVASTDQVVAIGDRAWRAVLDRHDDAVRRQLARFSGREAKHTGDGMLATFDGPARAIRCGTAIRNAARQIGLEVRVGARWRLFAIIA